MDSIQFSIEAAEPEQEILISQLSDLGAAGFEQTDDTLIAYFDENNFNSYELKEALKSFKYNIQNIPEQNWNKVWESNFEPVNIEDFCSVRAAFHKPVPGIKYEIIITPKMSFGTGHHATTYMMIGQMSRMNFSHKQVFDFGTGTGILAILAEKLGAENVHATDIDEWSITNAIENIKINSCNKITPEQSAILPAGPFDIILANINRNIILAYLGELKDSLKVHGSLLLSGLLKSDEEDIVSACKQNQLSFVKQLERSGWISLLFVK
ncbi:MAG TPA: 50S ribosomal protein L11 methyltransferase [Flavisolibacter sp.]|nr:50S ribosomal protein L11 methyltransferase [Flavisolibacter sp.]